MTAFFSSVQILLPSISFPILASTTCRKIRKGERNECACPKWHCSLKNFISNAYISIGINLSMHEKKKEKKKKSGHSRKSLVRQWECRRTRRARPYASRALDRSRPYTGNCIAAGECAGGFEISNFQSWFSSFNCWPPRCNQIAGQEFLFVPLPFHFSSKICLAFCEKGIPRSG